MKILNILKSSILFIYLNLPLNAEKVQFIDYLTQKRVSNENKDSLYNNVNLKLNVTYSDEKNPLHKLDIYIPSLKKENFPILIHFHGGGWKAGCKEMAKDTGLFYAKRGIIFIAPNYRLSPQVKHPTHIEDCALAVSWVFDHADEFLGDKTRIFISGHSAGAALAALLGTSQTYLKKNNIPLHNLAGIISVDTASFNLLSDRNEKIVKKMIEQAFGNDNETLKEASPFFNIYNNIKYPKFLILNTTNRKSAVKTSKDFVDKLKFAGCKVKFITTDNMSHRDMAIGMHEESNRISSSILQFILN